MADHGAGGRVSPGRRRLPILGLLVERSRAVSHGSLGMFRSVWTDEQVEAIVGTLLRTGVLIAALLVLVGGILYLSRYGSGTPGYRVFHGEPSDLRSVRGVLRDALAWRSRGVIQLGLLILIGTPVARVALSGFAFGRQRDTTYVVVTTIVLAVLIYSLLGRQP